jgi:hypothetical protein
VHRTIPGVLGSAVFVWLITIFAPSAAGFYDPSSFAPEPEPSDFQMDSPAPLLKNDYFSKSARGLKLGWIMTDIPFTLRRIVFAALNSVSPAVSDLHQI